MNGTLQEMTDEHIALLVQQGDKEKFGILMERYEKKLIRYGRKFLSDRDNVDDVVQEVFIKTFQSIRSFDVSQKFSPWIYRIAHNTYVNMIKKNSRNPLQYFDFDTVIGHPVYEDSDTKEKEQHALRDVIDKGLDKLSPDYREVIILYYLEELSYKEVADIIRIPIGTVGVRLRRAKAALKKVADDLKLHYES